MEHEITCLSGLQGTMRGLKVKDKQLFVDQKLAKSGRLIVELLSRCWERTTDPGPYTLDSKGQLVWPKVLTGDAYHAMFRLREISLGKMYPFDYACDSCKRSSHTEVDVTALPTKTLPEESKAHLSSGEPFESVVDGKGLRFRLLTLEDEPHITMLRTNRRITSEVASVVQRIVSIDGLPDTKPHVLRFIEDLDQSVFDDLRETLEAKDCGVDNVVELFCEHCYAPSKVILPFEVTFFSKRVGFSESPQTTTG